MKFIPKEPAELIHNTLDKSTGENIPTRVDLNANVNVSPDHPLKDLLRLVASILGIVLVIYLLLGFAVDLLVPHLSSGLEKSLGRLFQSQFITTAIPEKSKSLQVIMDKFSSVLTPDDRRLEYRVCVIQENTVNAVAIPGGMVVVFSGLLDKIATNDEIAFVLAHELGHFHYRHHLKAMGRSLLAMLFSVAVLGENSSASQFIVGSLYQMEMKFSRAQEKAADLYALNLLKKCYGSVAGALKFMEKQAREENAWQFFYYFASHPHPQQRLEYMREALKEP